MKAVRWFLVGGWNLLCVVVVLELSGNILYWADHGTLTWLRAKPPAEDSAPQEPFSAGDFRPILHPYFGYLYGARTGTAGRNGFHLNNHFFVQNRSYVERHPGCCDFPVVERAADEFIVGIFGGSVAGAVAFAAQQDDLLQRLLQHHPGYAAKQIRVLNFAIGAHKQPQQLQILAYYLSIGQKFDAVVTIDGFNEVRVGSENAEAGVSVDFPGTTWRLLMQHIDEQATRPQAEMLLLAYHDVAGRNWLHYGQSCRSGTCYLLARIASAWHRWNGTGAQPVARGSPQPNFFAVYRDNGGDVFERIADHWATSAALMHGLLAARSTPFLEVLQ